MYPSAYFKIKILIYRYLKCNSILIHSVILLDTSGCCKLALTLNFLLMYYNKNELTLLYNKNKSLDRKALAMAHTLGVRINMQELSTVRLSESLFIKFLDQLGVDAKGIVNKSIPYYQKELRGKEFNSSEWYEIIRHMPSLLKSPLAMYKDKAIICQSPNDMLRLS